MGMKLQVYVLLKLLKYLRESSVKRFKILYNTVCSGYCMYFFGLILFCLHSYKIKHAVQMGLVNDFPDGRYPSVNSVQGFGPAIRKVLDYKSIRGQFEGIRGELKGIRVTTLHLQINS